MRRATDQAGLDAIDCIRRAVREAVLEVAGSSSDMATPIRLHQLSEQICERLATSVPPWALMRVVSDRTLPAEVYGSAQRRPAQPPPGGGGSTLGDVAAGDSSVGEGRGLTGGTRR